MNTCVVETEKISKQFSGVVVLSEITLGFARGSVHGICGENGAGKSTLLKIVSGVYQPSSGSIIVNGIRHANLSVHDARRSGIIPILQDPTLIPSLSIAENLFLGNLPSTRTGIVRKSSMLRQAELLLENYSLPFDVREKVSALPLGKRRLLEIVRAAELQPSLIILDEPTASLSDTEVDLLGGIVEELRKRDTAVAYVSHRLREVLEFCDVVTVLRDGKQIATRQSTDLDEDELGSLMIGRTYSSKSSSSAGRLRPKLVDGSKVLLVGESLRIHPGKREFDLSIRTGEITGVYGLVGSGRTSLARAIAGLRALGGGHLKIDGDRYQPANPVEAAKHGVYFCPEDRKLEGLCLNRPVFENVSIISIKDASRKLGLISAQMEETVAEKICSEVNLKPLKIHISPAELSGGNQQKVLLARYFLASPKLLILDEPTVGVDIGARNDIHNLIRDRLSSEVSIVVISSDPEEIVALCDKVIVLRDGVLVGELYDEEITQETLSELAVGSAANKDVS